MAMMIGTMVLILEQAAVFFKGNIEELRMWNIARTATQISDSKNCELEGTETGLVAYYKFNQGVNAATNTSTTTLNAEKGSNGTLTNFTLTGTASNWLAESPITTSNICTSPTLNTAFFNQISEVVIYPNPSKGLFTIAIQKDAKVEVRDLLGKVIYANQLKAGNSIIDISNYRSGIYLLSVNTENGSIVNKLIKE